jgi:hypothetical protein
VVACPYAKRSSNEAIRFEKSDLPSVTPDRPRIDPDEPLRLADAVRYAFPRGGLTVSGLRTERGHGRLAIERISGKDFTTLRAIEEMRKLCRIEPKMPGFGSGPNGTTRK